LTLWADIMQPVRVETDGQSSNQVQMSLEGCKHVDNGYIMLSSIAQLLTATHRNALSLRWALLRGQAAYIAELSTQ